MLTTYFQFINGKSVIANRISPHWTLRWVLQGLSIRQQFPSSHIQPLSAAHYRPRMQYDDICTVDKIQTDNRMHLKFCRFTNKPHLLRDRWKGSDVCYKMCHILFSIHQLRFIFKPFNSALFVGCRVFRFYTVPVFVILSQFQRLLIGKYSIHVAFPTMVIRTHWRLQPFWCLGSICKSIIIVWCNMQTERYGGSQWHNSDDNSSPHRHTSHTLSMPSSHASIHWHNLMIPHMAYGHGKVWYSNTEIARCSSSAAYLAKQSSCIKISQEKNYLRVRFETRGEEMLHVHV